MAAGRKQTSGNEGQTEEGLPRPRRCNPLQIRPGLCLLGRAIQAGPFSRGGKNAAGPRLPAPGGSPPPSAPDTRSRRGGAPELFADFNIAKGTPAAVRVGKSR